MDKRPITVVQMLPALASGGVERGTLEVGAYLAANGHRSIVISAGGRMVKPLIAQGSEHVEWPIGKKSLLTLKWVKRLRDFLEKERVDVLHVRSRFPAWIAYLAWKDMPPASRPAFVTTVHGPYSVSPYSEIMTRGERVIVISNMIRDYVTTHYDIDESKLRLIYRGIDPKSYYFGYRPENKWLKDWFEAYPRTKNKQLLLLPARITAWKGHEDFIALVASLKQHRTDFHALIVGEVKKGKQKFQEKLHKQAKKAGIQDVLTFVGHRDDLHNIMAISSVVYSLAREPEAFGRTTIEALSLGKPVVGYAHGGVKEQLEALLPEGLVEIGNIAEAAMLTLRWLDQPPTIKENHLFTLPGMLEETLSVYHELVYSPSNCQKS